MLGAVAGDVIGSRFERANVKATRGWELFDPRESTFTDDTVLTLATAEALLTGAPYGETYRAFAREYPRAGYGSAFRRWFRAPVLPGPYNSLGNGSAMRVSPVAWARETLEEVLAEAEATALPTHDHPEGVKGAQAAAAAVFLARKGGTAESIREFVSTRFGYDLSRTVEGIRPGYSFDVTCGGSVPEAIVAALEGEDFEDAVRRAVSLGGDSDTIACIAGAIAEARFGGVPRPIREEALSRLPAPLRAVAERFDGRYGPKA